MKRSWEAVRDGDTYCAPACGAGCTVDEYFDAKRDGANLAKRLGEGWRSEVKENLGWYYYAVSSCGRIKVSAVRDGNSFTAFLGEPGQGLGGRWACHAKTPEQAIQDVVAEGLAAFDEIADLLDDLG